MRDEHAPDPNRVDLLLRHRGTGAVGIGRDQDIFKTGFPQREGLAHRQLQQLIAELARELFAQRRGQGREAENRVGHRIGRLHQLLIAPRIDDEVLPAGQADELEDLLGHAPHLRARRAHEDRVAAKSRKSLLVNLRLDEKVQGLTIQHGHLPDLFCGDRQAGGDDRRIQLVLARPARMASSAWWFH